MPRKIFNKILPSHKIIKDNKYLSFLGDKINHPKVLGKDRKSISGAIFIGLFIAFLPLPFQMVISSISAVYFRVNIVIATSIVWITNPFTMPPIYYAEYLIGSLVFKDEKSYFELDLDWITNNWNDIFINLYTGAFILSTIFSISGYLLINLFWKISIKRNKKK